MVFSKTSSSAAYAKVNDQRDSRVRYGGRWRTELGAWLSSALLLVCIVVVFKTYDNKPKPTLPLGIKLNALIAIIVKVGVGLLAVPLAAAMGQWKWIRVGGARLLSEFAAISDAAHSPWSSCMLLFRLRGGIVAAAGAFLVLSAQGIETFVQQSVKYPIGAVRTDTLATLPISDWFYSQATGESGVTPPDFGLKAAVYNGLFSSTPNVTYSVAPLCSGSSCTWQHYSTLSFCNTCNNITNRIRNNTSSAGFKYSLPSGLVLDLWDKQGYHYYNASTSSNYSIHSLEMTFLAMSSTKDWDLTPTAGKCTLQLCVRSFASAKFDDGRLSEIRSPDPPVPLTEFQMSYPSFSADGASWDGFPEWMDTVVSGAYFQYAPTGGTYNATSDARDAIFQVMTNERGNMNLQSLFDNVANSLTYTMRTVDLSSKRGDEGRPVANGTTYIATTMVEVEWAWLSFPFTVWALVLLYTIVVIVMSRQTPLWKDSTIATLCHGLNDADSKDVATLQVQSEMDAKAKDMHVRLVTDDIGIRLSRSVQSPTEMDPVRQSFLPGSR